jgi:hypothetical protein
LQHVQAPSQDRQDGPWFALGFVPAILARYLGPKTFVPVRVQPGGAQLQGRRSRSLGRTLGLAHRRIAAGEKWSC